MKSSRFKNEYKHKRQGTIKKDNAQIMKTNNYKI